VYPFKAVLNGAANRNSPETFLGAPGRDTRPNTQSSRLIFGGKAPVGELIGLLA